jgi:3-oxoacyl-[acyl-carrier-protein] synthase II
MEAWQRIGVYAAGLALDDGHIVRDPAYLSRTNLIVAAGSGERDTAVDAKILESISTRADTAVLAKEILPTALRPTLFLAQLSNLLAGNISIVHNVTRSSRTFMGEEMAGLSAIENAVRRIGAGQGDLFLVGGALNAEREDLLLNYELGCNLWAHPFKPVWERREAGGGFVPGSVGAFLVLESRRHAEARGVRPYARIRTVLSDHSQREPGQARDTLAALIDDASPGLAPGPLAVLSGASGVEPVTGEELECLTALSAKGFAPAIRAFGTPFGHSVEAHFPLGVALAALALEKGSFYPPFDDSGVEQAFDGPLDRVLVTGLGHWRGEGLALLERVGAREAA